MKASSKRFASFGAAGTAFRTNCAGAPLVRESAIRKPDGTREQNSWLSWLSWRSVTSGAMTHVGASAVIRLLQAADAGGRYDPPE